MRKWGLEKVLELAPAANWQNHQTNPKLSTTIHFPSNHYTFSLFSSPFFRLCLCQKLLRPSPSPQIRSHIFWRVWSYTGGWPLKNKPLRWRVTVSELSQELPVLPAINPSLPSFVISPREQHSRMTHLKTGRRSPLETGGDLGWALTSCARFPICLMGSPSLPARLVVEYWGKHKACGKSF